ncbi:S1C family serine protease [Brochothrix campestris]|uniref:Serine protease n=1 Tax=Brochothrix campestris FSL F6-1037 TaxID=1265861 RepID=W7CL71_9LIST|nr:S1C family serine protease [Brochothrix campestris]EUJ37752.1 serine protease [Brochothrix campestris FSL F6-1037]
MTENKEFDELTTAAAEETLTTSEPTATEEPIKTVESEGMPTESAPVKQKKSQAGYFFSGLVGVLVGALIIALFGGSLMGGNNKGATPLAGSDTKTTQSSNVKKVSVDATSSVTDAVKKAEDAVVSVLNYQKQSNGLDDILGGSNGSRNSQTATSDEAVESGSGSGVIYKKEKGYAYIVTNNHVIADADSLEVILSSGKKAEAKLIGADAWTDLAVLRIKDTDVKKVATFGDSAALKTGEAAIAIGSPLGTAYAGSVTQGIISGIDRTVPVDIDSDGNSDWETNVIQTDAAINPGNSGGALINIDGQVIGINSMKLSSSDVEGIGFAIPINDAEPIITALQTNGKVTRPSLGVTLRDLNTIAATQLVDVLKLPESITSGVMVQNVSNASAAADAGMKTYDVIVKFAGADVKDSMSLRKALYNQKLTIGDTVDVEIYRDGKKQTIKVKLKESDALSAS